MKRILIAAFVLVCGGCVPVGEVAIQKGMIRPEQRAVLLVFAGPGPWVTLEEDSKAESAAKFLPGVGQLVQSAQDAVDLKNSKQMQEYMPPWKPVEKFYPALGGALKGIRFPGVWVSTGAETETTPDVLEKFNRAQDILEWRSRYFVAEPGMVRSFRNYSTLLSLDDALVLEVNLQHGLLATEEMTHIPAISAVSRLYRAGTMKHLWSHEDAVSDKGGAKAIQEFMASSTTLINNYERMMPELAQLIAASLQKSLYPPATGALGTSAQPLAAAATAQALLPAATSQVLAPATTAQPVIEPQSPGSNQK